MGVVCCFGEALVDIYPQTQADSAQTSAANERLVSPGGAPANVAVAVAQLGHPARLLAQVGNDPYGQQIQQALAHYGVDTAFLAVHPSAPTAYASITLDADGERCFEFFRDETADLLMRAEQISAQSLQGVDIFHFCSNTLTTEAIAHTTASAVALAKRLGGLISFDVNLRHNLWPEGQADAAVINAYLAEVDILKVTAEEIDYLGQQQPAQFIKQALAAGVKVVLLTNASQSVQVFSQHGQLEIIPPVVQAIDTTAAGDCFIGGFLYSLAQQQRPHLALSSDIELAAMTEFASQCGAYAVTQKGAFNAMPNQAKLQQFFAR